MTLQEFLTNGLHLVLLIKLNLCQLKSLIWILLTPAGVSAFYIGSFTVSGLYKCANKYSKIYHFAGDTNLMNFQAFMKRLISKQINNDLKNLSNWFNANKIALNGSKIEPAMFSPPEKKIDHELKEKVNSKKHYQTDSVKYLGINLDKYLP